MYMYIYIYIHICMYIYIYIYLSIHIHKYAPASVAARSIGYLERRNARFRVWLFDLGGRVVVFLYTSTVTNFQQLADPRSLHAREPLQPFRSVTQQERPPQLQTFSSNLILRKLIS